ncbi:MAG: hypothetical protein GC165_08015 [Armatimonadetes bacterium]|nr:hypothetical protein [Armatimonadota bacterium]MBS1728932.1 hypothetical protein [Armatimonadota bacterium]
MKFTPQFIQPEKEPVVDTIDGKFVSPTDEDAAAREFFPEMVHDYRQTAKLTYPRILDKEGHEYYEDIIATFNKKTDREPSAVVEMEQTLRARYGRHFPAENFSLIGRYLRNEPLDALIAEREKLIEDFSMFIAGEQLPNICPLDRLFRPGEANFSLSIFWFNLAELYGYDHNAEKGLEAIGQAIQEFTEYAQHQYPYQDEPMRESDVIMLISRLVTRASYLDMMGEPKAADESLAHAESIDPKIYAEVLGRLSKQPHLEAFIERIRQ